MIRRQQVYAIRTGRNKVDSITRWQKSRSKLPTSDCETRRGSCLVWGCFSAHGMGSLHYFKGTIKSHEYIDILENVMLPYASQFLQQGFIYQEDNDPKHRSKDVQPWFSLHQVTRLDWPSQSPDLNIIEQLWNELKRRLAERKAKNVADKFIQLEEEWNSQRLPKTTIDKLIDSIPRRCQAVIDAKGFPTKY